MKIENRIKKQEEFQKTINLGKFLTNNEFKIYYLPNELKRLRVGISIPKKAGHAVVRNKIKRQINAMLLSIANLEKEIDIVIVPKRGFDTENFESNYSSLKSLFEKVGN